MTERELFERCKAVGVCGRGLVLRPNDEWAYNGFTVEDEIAYAILCGRLAAKVREHHPFASICPTIGVNSFAAHAIPGGDEYVGTTEVAAWLALAEKVCKPAEAPAPKMRRWAARAEEGARYPFGIAMGENVQLVGGQSFVDYKGSNAAWFEYPVPRIHDGLKPGEIREIGDQPEQSLAEFVEACGRDAEFEAECRELWRMLYVKHGAMNKTPDILIGIAEQAIHHYRARFGPKTGGGDAE